MKSSVKFIALQRRYTIYDVDKATLLGRNLSTLMYPTFRRGNPPLWQGRLYIDDPGGGFEFAYNSGMALQVDAVYENGVLRPLQPLDLREHEQVVVSVVKATPSRSNLAVEYVEKLKKELTDSEPAPGLEDVRKRLAKIPGSMAAEIIAERGDR